MTVNHLIPRTNGHGCTVLYMTTTFQMDELLALIITQTTCTCTYLSTRVQHSPFQKTMNLVFPPATHRYSPLAQSRSSLNFQQYQYSMRIQVIPWHLSGPPV
jgi:hypothetical protein